MFFMAASQGEGDATLASIADIRAFLELAQEFPEKIGAACTIV
jgi:hypothetical protein